MDASRYLTKRGLVELQGLERLDFWGATCAAGRGAGHRGLDVHYCPGLVWRDIPGRTGNSAGRKGDALLQKYKHIELSHLIPSNYYMNKTKNHACSLRVWVGFPQVLHFFIYRQWETLGTLFSSRSPKTCIIRSV